MNLGTCPVSVAALRCPLTQRSLSSQVSNPLPLWGCEYSCGRLLYAWMIRFSCTCQKSRPPWELLFTYPQYHYVHHAAACTAARWHEGISCDQLVAVVEHYHKNNAPPGLGSMEFLTNGDKPSLLSWSGKGTNLLDELPAF